MLRLSGGQVESLFDLGLPVEVRELPEDLRALDELLDDRELFEPIVMVWRPQSRGEGRPTIPMERYVRLMVLKARTGWGYETLVREVSDSLHLRRFCRIALAERVPDESTIRKLTRRLGAEVVDEITRALIAKKMRERRFRPRAMRCDSTVVEADVRHPSDAALATSATRALARESRLLAEKLPAGATRVRDRSRAAAKRLRLISRTLARRTGEKKTEVLRLTGQTGELVRRSVAEARRLIAQARRSARGRGARAKLRGAQRLKELADRCERIAEQIALRLAAKKITGRIVSLADPDARPIVKGKLGKLCEFGYIFQLAELTENTRRGARGLILPAASEIGAPNDCELIATTAEELTRLGITPREVALDGGFEPGPTNTALPEHSSVFIAARQQPESPRSRRRLASYRTGCEGRISHLKRRYGLRRTRLKGHAGARTWVGWGILAYNLDTLAIRTS